MKLRNFLKKKKKRNLKKSFKLFKIPQKDSL